MQINQLPVQMGLQLPVYQQQFCMGFDCDRDWLRPVTQKTVAEAAHWYPFPLESLICWTIEHMECILWLWLPVAVAVAVVVAVAVAVAVAVGVVVVVVVVEWQTHQRHQSSSPNRWCSAPPELWKQLQLGFEYGEIVNKMPKRNGEITWTWFNHPTCI